MGCFDCNKLITVRLFPHRASPPSLIMLSVIIPTEGAEQPAVATLAALVPGAAAGLIREVLLVDGTRNGVIERVADVAGCRFISYEGSSHGRALAAGALQARSSWLMFLPPG